MQSNNLSDYSLKSEILNNGIYDDFSDVMSTLTRTSHNLPPLRKSAYQDFESAQERLDFLRSEWGDELKVCFQILNAKKQRAKRLNSKIRAILRGDSVFCTLTFTDDVLRRTTAFTRRDYVTRWLKSVGCCGIGNIDFGKTNGREHYHCLVSAKRVDLNSWKYGNLDCQAVRLVNESTSEKLAHYIAKLTNHAIKETTHGNRVIYSGDFDSVVVVREVPKRENPYSSIRCHCPLIKPSIKKWSHDTWAYDGSYDLTLKNTDMTIDEVRSLFGEDISPDVGNL